jgi:hypothetical protein
MWTLATQPDDVTMFAAYNETEQQLKKHTESGVKLLGNNLFGG